MSIINLLRRNKFLLFILSTYIFLFITMPDKAFLSVDNSGYYILEMLKIMPVIFILTSIIEAWVPKKVIFNGFGEGSGIKGNIFSFMIGSLSAGPIYAAFPLCKMLLNKGASVANIVIILSAWAVIKIPMLITEAKFLGFQFMTTRWVLTVLSVILMSYIVSSMVHKEDIPIEIENTKETGNVKIKEAYCTGCTLCTKLLPDQFVMVNKKAKLKKSVTDEGIVQDMKQVIEKCPATAIIFE